ncbi:MAG TPA: hypothetical protein VED37_12050 [Ktedonobacteraceae bacterium]|nr:hypothetical protein [Ktedonobacteraceae bacterium]
MGCIPHRQQAKCLVETIGDTEVLRRHNRSSVPHSQDYAPDDCQIGQIEPNLDPPVRDFAPGHA